MQSTNREESEEFDWIQRQAQLFASEETFKEKFIRKFKDNPFVPIGCLLTSAALGYGLYSFRKGDSRKSQLMMRSRVFAQGFTIVALVTGLLITAAKKST